MRRAYERMGYAMIALSVFLSGCSSAAPSAPPAGQGQAKPTEAAAPTAAPAARPTEAAKPAGQPPAAAAPAAPGAASGGKNDVTLGMGASLITLDPHFETNNQLASMLSHMMDTLTVMSPDLKLTGQLAESWKPVDATTWEFKLRPNVKFHDGSPFSAQVAKYNIDWVMDSNNKASGQRAYVSDIVETQAVDDLTLRIKTKAPSGTFPSRIQRLAMNSMKAMQEKGAEQFARSPVGTGPYKFVEYVRDDHLTVERFDGYWGSRPAIGRVTFKFIPEDATRVAALQAGTVDVALNMPPDIAAQLDSDRSFRVERVHTLRNQFVNINTKTPPLDNVKVRQALNYAVDKEAIVKNILLGTATVTPSICDPGLVFGCPKDLKLYPYDPARARQLLAEAGYPNGFATSFFNSQGRYLSSVDIGAAITGYFDKVGIKTTTEMRDWGVFQTQFTNGQMPTLFYLGFGNQFADVDGVFAGHLDSKRRALYWNTPETDAKIAAQLAELDEGKRGKLAEDIVRDIYNQAPWVFLFDIHDIHVTKANLSWKPRPDEAVLMQEASWK